MIRSPAILIMVLAGAASLATASAVAQGRSAAVAALPAPPAASSTPPIGVQVVARMAAPLAAPMAGQLISFPSVDGDKIEAGQLLARFNCAQQQAVQMRAKAELAKRQDILTTQQALKSLNAYSRADFAAAQNDVAVAKAELALTQTAIDNCEVKAPFGGRVSAVSVHNHQFVQAGAPLLELVDDRDLELELIVSSMTLAWLQVGAEVRIHVSETQQDYGAKVTRMSGRVDAASQTIKVYAQIVGDSSKLLPGMSGVAQLADAQR